MFAGTLCGRGAGGRAIGRAVCGLPDRRGERGSRSKSLLEVRTHISRCGPWVRIHSWLRTYGFQLGMPHRLDLVPLERVVPQGRIRFGRPVQVLETFAWSVVIVLGLLCSG